MEKKEKTVGKIVATVAAGILIVSLLSYGIYYHDQAKSYKYNLENQYNRAFYDLLDNISATENYLLKAAVTGTSEMQTMMLEEASAAAAQAESCLSLLPVDQNLMSKISNFLVQLKDISHTWNNAIINGTPLTKEQYQTLEDLYGYSQDLTGAFQAVWTDLGNNAYGWSDISRDSANLLNDKGLMEKYASLRSLGDPFEDYPSLIYDGPFSEHTKTVTDPGPEGETVSREQAEEYVKQLFKAYTPNVTYTETEAESAVAVYSFKVTFGEADAYVAYADVSQKGGKLCSMIFYRETGEASLSPTQAVKAGERYLTSLGYTDMKSSYYSVQGNYVTANYSFYKDNILYYPDMVKVKVALDTGEVTGFEGTSYLLNHRERTLTENKISMEEAEKKLSPHVTLENACEAVIPNDFGGENHVYEFKCSYEGRDVLIYMDTVTGKETEVLLILENESGVLTA